MSAPQMTSNDQISEDSMSYLKEKRIPEMMEYFLRSIIQEKPVDPKKYLAELAAQPLPPRIILAGPPASGKGTQATQIVSYYKRKTGKKPVHISSGSLLRDEVEKGTQLGKAAHSYMQHGELVPDSLVIGITKARLLQEDAVTNGWLLDGFPRTAAQASALDAAGFAPTTFVVLDVPEDALVERVEGRRTDPETGTIYHIKFNPPPSDDIALLDRLEQREDDTREVVVARLHDYHKYVDGLLEFYGSVTYRVDADRPTADISADIVAYLDKVEVK